MNLRLRTLATLVTLLAMAGAVIALGHVGDRYTLRAHADNAEGLRPAADVRVAGLTVGKVTDVELGDGDRPVITMALDADQAPVHGGASLSIAARNLLGQKFVELHDGAGREVKSGSTLPAESVSAAVDLDQVLDVLDADTRNRLALLIDTAAASFGGRREDLQILLENLPRSSSESTRLLDDLVADNHTLADVVRRSDAFLSEVAHHRSDMTGAVDEVTGLATVLAERREPLRAALAESPGTLREAQGALADLRDAAIALRPAAGRISATAGPLNTLLAEFAPTRSAAAPALDAAQDVAPALTRLGAQGAPILRRAIPTTGALRRAAVDSRTLTKALDGSIDNVLGVIDNWTRAIQLRDGFSHVFNGAATVSADTLESALRRLGEPTRSRDRTRPAARPQPARRESQPRPTQTPAPAKPTGGGRLPSLVDDVLSKVPELGPLQPTVDELNAQTKPLLDLLLGP